MSISSEITRISNAKTAIAESIANKGVTVPSGTKIDGMAALIDSIQTGGGGAVQPSKALTVTSNGTTTITPDAPYDAIKQVDLTVNVPGIEMCSLTIKARGPAFGSPQVWYFDGEKVTQVAAYGTAVQAVKNSMVCSNVGTLSDSSGVLSNIASPYNGIYIWQIIKSGTVYTI